ncbi:glutamine--fructose-6-phosphate transaminase (isomerizing) [Clostridium minihomine]|uniref:glutamine--fructose-6-phosphate transaminase (isomerizing) n=1 Tax=Clostridium minihomine TaxID=2045012 RepID=UPI000C75C676|nr:glutamine--fructose-6-phosphate transaminase (isomerizing) [Clostridium minihomine]
MCGIVGYIGGDQAAPILLSGLEKLEYRGYDSAGMAVYTGDSLQIAKSKGRLQVLHDLVDGGKKLPGSVGIGHTRWATHGKPSDINSHPQVSKSGKFAVVHNGIIENYQEIKQKLIQKDVNFVSETDTEVVAQLLEYYYKGDILDAFIKVISRLQGSYALGILCVDDPEKLYAVRKDSPLVVGLGEHENYVASDIPSILNFTRDFYRLKDNEVVELTRQGVKIFNMEKEPIEKELVHVDWDLSVAEKGGYEHFMFKEIMEQPKALRDTISPRIKDGRIVLDDVTLTAEQLKQFNRISIVACGSAYHVGVVAKYVIEKLTRIPVEVDVASEFRYRQPILDSNSLVIVISQSGETADTLAALRESKRLGARVLSIVNVVGSSIANDSDDVLYTWAGPEIAVATTKAYSTQLAVVYLLAIYMADLLGKLSAEEYDEYVRELQALPDKVEQALQNKEDIQYFASKHFSAKDIFFIGRNLDYAISMEGSLKLKEISYIHSEAYAAGELKHGTISLMEEGTLVVAIATHQQLLEKMMSNVIEVRSRGALVLGLTTEDNGQIEKDVDFLFTVPSACEIMRPSLAVIPLQLFSYYMASMKGCDIDKPRNLAKSVTVE